ncbi:hypothetical protein RE474_03745 [Methanolobus sediminis]|uniref:Uncharacterized protein n=1 Tax=Methanolobus sediminis TaxID=3072978 RepID=A0AA51YJT0_9EURY|nr:hypothetical protein [Methanolobus sediminis]WMW25840.1 hypothetical protein RE474_03745 [Methanolobus sediminis]
MEKEIMIKSDFIESFWKIDDFSKKDRMRIAFDGVAVVIGVAFFGLGTYGVY